MCVSDAGGAQGALLWAALSWLTAEGVWHMKEASSKEERGGGGEGEEGGEAVMDAVVAEEKEAAVV